MGPAALSLCLSEAPSAFDLKRRRLAAACTLPLPLLPSPPTLQHLTGFYFQPSRQVFVGANSCLPTRSPPSCLPGQPSAGALPQRVPTSPPCMFRTPRQSHQRQTRTQLCTSTLCGSCLERRVRRRTPARHPACPPMYICPGLLYPQLTPTAHHSCSPTPSLTSLCGPSCCSPYPHAGPRASPIKACSSPQRQCKYQWPLWNSRDRVKRCYRLRGGGGRAEGSFTPAGCAKR